MAPIPPRVRAVSPSLVLLVAIGTLLSSLVPAGAGVGSAAPSFGSSQGGTGVPSGPVTCSGLVTNATLTALASQYYPNGSLLPSESDAEQAVTATWNDLCGSAAFQHAVSSAGGGWFEYAARMQDKNWTASGGLVGSLFVIFELAWNASCPNGGTVYPSGYGCQFDDVWQANLTDSSVTGPAATVTSLRFVPCETPTANETAVGSVGGFFPDPGGAPNESVAVQEVQTIWGSICSSTTYYGLAASLDLPQDLSFSTWRASTGPNTTLSPTGHLYFQWSLFTGDRPCPSVNGSSLDGLTCSYFESWTADLTQDTYSGPAATSYPNFGSSAPIAESPGNNPSPTWVLTVVGYGAFGAVVLAALMVGVVGRRRP